MIRGLLFLKRYVLIPRPKDSWSGSPKKGGVVLIVKGTILGIGMFVFGFPVYPMVFHLAGIVKFSRAYSRTGGGRI
jgi:hypothetical protein